jgi:hypothetical protein
VIAVREEWVNPVGGLWEYHVGGVRVAAIYELIGGKFQVLPDLLRRGAKKWSVRPLSETLYPTVEAAQCAVAELLCLGDGLRRLGG